MKRRALPQRAKAARLLEECGIHDAPVDLSRVAQHLGLTVREGAYDGDISGFLYQDGTRTVIGINRAHSVARRRFTLAHEIAHYVLHNRETTFVDRLAGPTLLKRDARSASGTDPREVEANAFAADLLMPAAFLERDLDGIDDRQDVDSILADLARKYRVSVEAMTIRLVRLGYLDTPPY